jgi:hypothetical protein
LLSLLVARVRCKIAKFEKDSRWRLLHRALTTGLTDETRKNLDGLLRIAPEMTITRLTWLRNASQSPAPTNILGLIERVEFPRKLGIDRERQQAIPASAFDRIAREALKISAQHFAETAAPRRHALLTAAALSLETGLTDATLLMFDKLMGSLSGKAERRSREKAAKVARDLQEKLRALTGACTAMIRARENRDDPFIAIERQMKMGWSQFVAFVTETESIIAPDKTDPKAEVLRRYATVRKIAPAFLEAFTFRRFRRLSRSWTRSTCSRRFTERGGVLCRPSRRSASFGASADLGLNKGEARNARHCVLILARVAASGLVGVQCLHARTWSA